MGVLYVARSAKLSKWASDVGLSKHVFKVGCGEEPLQPAVEAGWAGETDWTVIGKREVPDLDEAAVLERLGRKVKPLDPFYYPRLKGERGLFKVLPAQVENHLLIARALAGTEELKLAKLKPADFASFLIQNALG